MKDVNKKIINLASDLYDMAVVLEFFCCMNSEEGTSHLRPVAKTIRKFADELYYELAFAKDE